MKIWFILFLLSGMPHAFAEDIALTVMPIGHNLDMTGYTLKKGYCTVGFQFAGCGVSNQFTLGTSPWLLTSYNSYNLFGRLSFDKTEDHGRAFQLAYIQSYPTAPAGLFVYEMTLLWLSYIHTFYLSSSVTTHVNISGMYYFDELAPFSLRRPNFYRDPWQFNFGFLTEVKIVGGLYLNAEVAILDAIKKYFHIHTGMSMEYRGGWWLAHVGISQSATMNSFSYSSRDDEQFYFWGIHPVDEYFVSRDYTIHPEFALQVYF